MELNKELQSKLLNKLRVLVAQVLMINTYLQEIKTVQKKDMLLIIQLQLQF